MKVWRLTRPEHVALDGAGAARLGGRYSSPGLPLVSFASEPGLAVLVALRYATARTFDDELVLGWTTIDAPADRVPNDLTDPDRIAYVDAWAAARRSLAIAIRSAVLPEADVILMNVRHADAARVGPLVTRAFTFATCLHRPPMLDRYNLG